MVYSESQDEAKTCGSIFGGAIIPYYLSLLNFKVSQISFSNI